jgi:simple sugar transport system permease protein
MVARFVSAGAGCAQSHPPITNLAAVLDGVDPQGGFGRISGLMVALVVLQVIASELNLLGLSQHLTLAIWGATLVAVMGTRFLLVSLLTVRRDAGR